MFLASNNSDLIILCQSYVAPEFIKSHIWRLRLNALTVHHIHTFTGELKLGCNGGSCGGIFSHAHFFK